MKEIADYFKQTRESMEISIKEVCEDLKVDESLIIKLEEGDMSYFKDITSLKVLIRDYSKYLGLDTDEMIDNFNEYLFDFTSRISLEEIKSAKKNEKIEEEKKIKSPYTIEYKQKFYKSNIFVIGIIIILLAFIGYFVYNLVIDKDSIMYIINEV